MHSQQYCVSVGTPEVKIRARGRVDSKKLEEARRRPKRLVALRPERETYPKRGTVSGLSPGVVGR